MSVEQSRSTEPSRGHGLSARRRVLLSALAGICVGGPAALAVPWMLSPLVAWDVAALVYVSWIWFGTSKRPETWSFFSPTRTCVLSLARNLETSPNLPSRETVSGSAP